MLPIALFIGHNQEFACSSAQEFGGALPHC